MKQNIILWLGALIITFLAGYLSNVIGPYYPISGAIGIEGRRVTFKFDKIYSGEEPYRVLVKSDIKGIEAYLLWKEIPVKGSVNKLSKQFTSEWSRVRMSDSGEFIMGILPKYYPGEKVAYRVELNYKGKQYYLPEVNPVVITLWGKVNPGVMQIFYFVLFGGLILAVRTGLEVFKDKSKLGIYTIFTLIFFFLYTVCLVPLKRTYEVKAINHFVPNLSSLITLQSVLLFVLWIVGLVIIFNFKGRKWIPLVISSLTLVIYIFIHY